jgi:hypothetical protein
MGLQVRPGFVATRLAPIGVTWLIPTPQVFVRHALRTVGIAEETSCYIMHNFIYAFCKIMQCFMPSLCLEITRDFYLKVFAPIADEKKID